MTDNRIEIIAEIANAHQGSPEQAAKLAQAGFEAGADAVKFQMYFAEELLVRRHPRFGHFLNQSFSPEIWAKLIASAKENGPVYCDVFGLQAVELATDLGVDALKIHSSDTTNIPLVKAAKASGKRIILSSGGTTARELSVAVEIVANSKLRPLILHGYQGYPTAVEESELVRLTWLHQTFGGRCDIGYMDHVSGDDEFATLLPLLAIGAGAATIEKHITFNRAANGVDYYSSLEPDSFARFVATVRRAETSFGINPMAFAPSERIYRETAKKHWVSTKALPKGHSLTSGDLVMKRIPTEEVGAGAIEMDKLVGRELLRDINEEHAFVRLDVKQTVWALPVARVASARLPGKALLDVAGIPALGHLFGRLKRIECIDKIVFCTTSETDCGPLATLAEEHDIECHRGPVEDVLARMLGAIEGKSVDIVLRVTGDDILIDKDYVKRAVDHHLSTNTEYSEVKDLPSGTEVEIFDAQLLWDIWSVAMGTSGTEYLTLFVTENADQFRTEIVPVDTYHTRDFRLTLDTSEDLQVIRLLLEEMRRQGKALDYNMDDIVRFFEENPETLEINSAVRQRSRPVIVDTRLDWRRPKQSSVSI
jgi:sialic acid synthase SpsE/spore coat polysaccharide biosynthesis protein SpsF (cytidylyltransferase family)